MGKIEELKKNRVKMDKNDSLMSKVCVAYLAVCGMIAAGYIVLAFMFIDVDYMLFGVFTAAILAFGYLGGYSHNNTLAIIAPAFAGAAFLYTGNVVFLILTLMAAVLLVMTIRVNTVYDELSREDGFPQFDEIFEEQKEMSDKIKLIEAEHIKKLKNADFINSNDLGGVSGNTEIKSAGLQNDGIMDSI